MAASTHSSEDKTHDAPVETIDGVEVLAGTHASIPQAENNIRTALASHTFDPNMDLQIVQDAEAALEKGDLKAEAALEAFLEEDSPYPEVRSSTSNVDDPSLPVDTFRAWFLGIIAVIIVNGVDQLLYYRYPSVRINSTVVQLVTFPLGKLMARYLPERVFKTPFGSFTLNPGPFNAKEHTLISLMSSVTYQGAYATDVLAAQRFFYGQQWGFGYQIMVVLSTQLIGFSLAGAMRNFLIYPGSAIWPAALVQTALMGALHSLKKRPDGYLSRGKFFSIAFTCAFFYYFLPGYLATFLSGFGWIAWMAPNNAVVSQIFGVYGLGLGFITFDWSQIAYIGSPLVTPWWAEANVLVGLVIFVWVISPALYFTNWNNTGYLPIVSSHSFDRFGNRFQPRQILTDLKTFDPTKYETYSDQYLPVTLVVSYGLSFASIIAVLVHLYLYHRHDIVRQFKFGLKEEPDIHARLMRTYKEVPHWWYAVIGVICFVLGIVAIEVWPTQMPVWAFILSLIIGAVFILPIGVILSLTNQELGLNVITEFIIGFATPGKPVSMLLFKTWGYMTMYQGLLLVSDQKFAHYMKIPPRSTFWAQLIPTFIASFVVVLVQNWAFDNISDICDADQPDNFSCPGTTVFATASIVWGLIGPSRIFAVHQRYVNILWFFFAGAVAPIPTYFLAKRYPRSFLRYVSWPVIFGGVGLLPPATGINFSSWVLVGFIFNFVIRRKFFFWWSERNYVLSAALDAGTGISAIIIFFCLQFPKGPQQSLSWWGNDWWQNTADGLQTPWLTVDPNIGAFAPAPNGNYEPNPIPSS